MRLVVLIIFFVFSNNCFSQEVANCFDQYVEILNYIEKHDGKLCDSMYYILDDGLTQLPVFKRLLVLEDGQLCSMIAMLK